MNMMASPGEGILVEANCLIRQSFHHPLFVRRPLKCFGSWNHRKYATISAYLIFVTKFTNETCGEKFVMWRHFRFPYMTNVEKSEISSYAKCGGFWNDPMLHRVISEFSTVATWREISNFSRTHIFLQLTLFLRIFFVAIYAFVCGENLYVEKKWKIWGMNIRSTILYRVQWY